MKISVIIPTYNEQETISACLDSLLNQSRKAEIIVVDDGSGDNTLDILRRYQQQGKITLLTQKHQGPAIARNKAASVARGEILVFADADMTFDKDYLQKLVAPIEAGKVIGTYTTAEKVSNWESVWARCWNIEEGWEPKMRFPSNPPKWGTDFRAILKTKFVEVDGFDDIGYTDTWTLAKKLDKKPLATNAVCYHHNPDNLLEVCRQAKWVAKRPYKWGHVGVLFALIRTSLPVSVVVGLAKSILNLQPAFLIFKITYDLGRFVGIIHLLVSNNTAK